MPLLIGTCAGFALLAGVVDLSIGSMVGFGGTVLALLVAAHWSPWAAGGDDLAATRAGISVPRLRFVALLFSASGAGLGGIMYAGQLGSSSNVLGTGLEFQVYAALMIGGFSILRGGVGNSAGGAMGLLVVAGVANILDVKAVSPYYVNIIVGLLLLAAVLIDRLRGGDAYE